MPTQSIATVIMSLKNAKVRQAGWATLFLNAFAFSSSVVIHRVRQQTLAFEVVLNANTVLCNQQPCNNASSYSVTGTAHRSHECTMTTAQRSTWKEHSRKPLNAAATCNLKKKKRLKRGEKVGKVQKCVSVLKEKLQLDLCLPDLTWQNDTDCFVRKQ